MWLNYPTLSSSEKLKVGWVLILSRLNSGTASSVHGRAMDITQGEHVPILPEVAMITLMVPRGGLEEDSLLYTDPV